MSVHNHTANGREWLMVEVPNEARDIQYYPDSNTIDYWKHDHSTSSGEVQLPDGTWRIHSDSHTITEQQAAEIVEYIVGGELHIMGYKDYDAYKDKRIVVAVECNAISSYRSLLRSKQINSRVINLIKH